MTLRQMNAIVAAELKRWPRGPRGSAQNLFRAVYQCMRMNSLGKRAEIATADVLGEAVRLVRLDFPGFRPLPRTALT